MAARPIRSQPSAEIEISGVMVGVTKRYENRESRASSSRFDDANHYDDFSWFGDLISKPEAIKCS